MANLSIDWNSALTNLLKVGGSIAESAITKTRSTDTNSSMSSYSNPTVSVRGASSSSVSGNNLLLILLPVGLVLLVVLLLKK